MTSDRVTLTLDLEDHRPSADAPERYPALTRELMRPLWPDRQWIARLYHYFRPHRVVPTVDFDTPACRATSTMVARASLT